MLRIHQRGENVYYMGATALEGAATPVTLESLVDAMAVDGGLLSRCGCIARVILSLPSRIFCEHKKA